MMKDHDTDSNSSDDDEVEQVRVVLQLADHCESNLYKVTDAPIAVPSTTTRKGLSKIVNHLLLRNDNNDADDDKNDIPFDFILANKLLRTGIEREARRSGLSLESAIPIVYFPAQRAPEMSGDCDTLPDWVGCLSSSASNNNVLCAGCYDGSVQMYDTKQGSFVKTVQTMVHSGPIVAMDLRGNKLLTGSMDHTVKMHNVTPADGIGALVDCVDGHGSAISSVRFNNANGKTFASADWEGQLCVWDAAATVNQAQPQKKSKSESNNNVTQSTLSPQFVVAAHTSNVAGLSWQDDRTLVSGSWDHSLKVWDVSRTETIRTFNCGRVISCLDGQATTGIVVSGHPDCTLRLWDTRSNDSVVSTHTSLKSSHKEWITSVQWSPVSTYHLASTSRDGTIKLWDVRSQLPLHTIRVTDEKCLCLLYTEQSIFSGGTDCVIKRLRFPEASN